MAATSYAMLPLSVISKGQTPTRHIKRLLVDVVWVSLMPSFITGTRVILFFFTNYILLKEVERVAAANFVACPWFLHRAELGHTTGSGGACGCEDSLPYEGDRQGGY
jgi:hypothetical protein